MGLRHRLWWWFHRCIRISTHIKLYTLIMHGFLYVKINVSNNKRQREEEWGQVTWWPRRTFVDTEQGDWGAFPPGIRSPLSSRGSSTDLSIPGSLTASGSHPSSARCPAAPTSPGAWPSSWVPLTGPGWAWWVLTMATSSVWTSNCRRRWGARAAVWPSPGGSAARAADAVRTVASSPAATSSSVTVTTSTSGSWPRPFGRMWPGGRGSSPPPSPTSPRCRAPRLWACWTAAWAWPYTQEGCPALRIYCWPCAQTPTQATAWWGSCGSSCRDAGGLDEGLPPQGPEKGLRTARGLRTRQLSICLPSNFPIWRPLTKPTWPPKPCGLPVRNWWTAPQEMDPSWEALVLIHRTPGLGRWADKTLTRSLFTPETSRRVVWSNERCTEFRAKVTMAQIPYY